MVKMGGTGQRKAHTNLKKDSSVCFRFWPNGTSDPSTTGTTQVRGEDIASITHEGTGTYLATFHSRHGRLMSFHGNVLQATQDTFGPPKVWAGQVVEGSSGATTLYLYTYHNTGTVDEIVDLTAAGTTFVVCEAKFEEIIL